MLTAYYYGTDIHMSFESFPDGPDYTGVSMDLSYDATNMGDTMCVLIPITNDTKVENEESFYTVLQLTPSGDPIDFDPDMSRITIIDDDSTYKYPLDALIPAYLYIQHTVVITVHTLCSLHADILTSKIVSAMRLSQLHSEIDI